MAYERLLDGALDYAPCRYGKSKLLFRGPRASLRGDYVAFLGSTETYGKFIEMPYPELTGQALGMTSLNLGCVNAGIDTFHDDPTVQELCRSAQACVVQIMGAQKLSNRLYTVHPRRNDRFLAASKLLETLYPEAEFTEIHFTRHLLSMLASIDAGRFREVRDEISAAWVSRMVALVTRVQVPTVMLWIADHSPDVPADLPDGSEPLFVTRAMLDEVGARASGLVEVIVSHSDTSLDEDVGAGIEAMVARELPGPGAHSKIAQELTPTLQTRL
ncbi:MAG: DUF6473 family protein [Pseudomonadota bacterium]